MGLEREIWALRTSGADVQDALQRAVMGERLGTLERDHRELIKGMGVEERSKAKKRLGMMRPGGHGKGGEPRGPGESHDVLKGVAGKRKNASSVSNDQLMEIDLFEDVRPKKGGGGGQLIETERDRLIRLGVLTPFDNLGEYEKKIQGADRIKGASIADVGRQMTAAGSSRRATKLMDPSELPRPQRAAKKMRENFWREGAKAKLDTQRKKIAEQKRQSRLGELRDQHNGARVPRWAPVLTTGERRRSRATWIKVVRMMIWTTRRTTCGRLRREWLRTSRTTGRRRRMWRTRGATGYPATFTPNFSTTSGRPSNGYGSSIRSSQEASWATRWGWERRCRSRRSWLGSTTAGCSSRR